MSAATIADAALHLLDPTSVGRPETLAELTERLDHIKGTKQEWIGAVAYLAAQYHAVRATSGADRARDASFAVSQIAYQIDHFRKLYPEAEK